MHWLIDPFSLLADVSCAPPTHTPQEIYLARAVVLYQRDGGEGWASKRKFGDAMEYFD